MKTKNKTAGRNNRIIVLALVSMLLLSVTIFAQRPPRGSSMSFNHYRGSSFFILGVEGGVSMRTFTIKSDIEGINQLKAVQEGWSAGLVVGGKGIRSKLLFGSYSNSSTISTSIGQKSFSGQVNVYPFSFLNVSSKYFQPYVIAGIDISNISFFGTAIPQPKPYQEEKENCPPCNCDDGGSTGLPADPDQVSGSNGPPGNPGEDPDLVPTPRLDKMIATQALAGIGVECNFKTNGRVFSMFGEARYGIPLGVEAITQPLANTSITGQMVLYFGISMGLSK